jgi:hypothetical protein
VSDIAGVSNCTSDNDGDIGVLDGYQIELNFTYEVELDKKPRATLYFVTETLPYVERALIDYLGRFFFKDNCTDSYFNSIIGLRSRPKDIVSVNMDCEPRNTNENTDQDSHCIVMEGKMTLVYVSSDGVDQDIHRICGTLLSIVDRTFGNETNNNSGVQRISVIALYYNENNKVVPSSASSTTTTSPQQEDTFFKISKLGFIGIIIAAAICCLLIIALIYKKRKRKKEKEEWDELSKTFGNT